MAAQTLPAASPGKPQLLKINTRAKGVAAHLPFVAARSKKVTAPFWNVPATGGYLGGYKTGEAMALAFLKFLREDSSQITPVRLVSVVESLITRFGQEGGAAMAARRPSEWSEGFDSLRGQSVGFINTIAVWVAAAAKQLGGDLDGLDEASLLHSANAGLAYPPAAFFAQMEA